MRKFPVIAVVLLSAALLATAMVRAADDSPAAAPTTQAGDSKSGGRVSFKPFSGLTSLSAEQVSKIDAIHKKYLADESELKKKHEADCMAVLSDAQKEELKTLHEKELSDGKAKRADAKQKAKDGGK